MTTEQKAAVSTQITGAVLQAFETGAIGRGTVLKELRKISSDTGIWTTITDEELEEAVKEPKPPSPGEQPEGQEGGGGGLAGLMGGGGPGMEPPKPELPKSAQAATGGAPKGEDSFLPGLPDKPPQIDQLLPGSNVIPLRRGSTGQGVPGLNLGGFLPRHRLS
jgi:hypothetical protein